MAEFEKKTKRHPTDLTDEEWARIAPFLPGAAKSGRPARTDLREVFERDPISGPLGRRPAGRLLAAKPPPVHHHKQHGGGPRNRFPVHVGVGVADRAHKEPGRKQQHCRVTLSRWPVAAKKTPRRGELSGRGGLAVKRAMRGECDSDSAFSSMTTKSARLKCPRDWSRHFNPASREAALSVGASSPAALHDNRAYWPPHLCRLVCPKPFGDDLQHELGDVDVSHLAQLAQNRGSGLNKSIP